MRNTYTAVSADEYRKMRGKQRHGTEVLQDVIVFSMNSVGRVSRNLGTVNDRRIRGGSARSLHAVGRAGDVGINNYSDGLWLFMHLINAADLIGLDEVIYWGFRWDATSGKVKRYHGVNQHHDHVHWGIDVAMADSPLPSEQLQAWFAGCIFGRQNDAPVAT